MRSAPQDKRVLIGQKLCATHPQDSVNNSSLPLVKYPLYSNVVSIVSKGRPLRFFTRSEQLLRHRLTSPLEEWQPLELVATV